MALALGVPQTDAEVAASQDLQFTLAAVTRFRHGAGYAQVVARLVEEGLAPDHAERIATAARERKRRLYREDGGRNMFLGGLVLAVGLVVTVGSMLYLRQLGVMVLSWGALLFGAVTLARGVGQFFSA